MNDILYIGTIPNNYHYARFSNNYIDLFSQPNLQGELDYYRVYMYDNSFQSEHLSQTFNQYNYSTAKNINVTNDILYRRDFPSIMFMSTIYILLIVFLFNLVTSVFKKGVYSVGFYNILYLLKKISFNFTNILKYLCIFMIIFLVGFSLMLTFSKKVSAESDVVCYPTGQAIVDLPYSIYTTAINYVQQSNYTDYFIVRTDSASADSRYWLILF